MFSKTLSATLLDLEPIKIEVEVNGSRGIPRLIVVGLASQAVNEAKERVRAAISSVGHRLKSYKTVVNLAPADIKKNSAHLELAMAVGLLQMNEAIPEPAVPTAFLGELSLNGQVRPIKGALPLVLALKSFGIQTVFVPYENLAELTLVRELQIYGLKHLGEYMQFVRGHRNSVLPQPPITPAKSPTAIEGFSSILGQSQAKRALVIAAAGGHHLLMVGPPGTGKTTLAKSLPALLPTLSEKALTEVSCWHSLAGDLSYQPPSPPLQLPASNISQLRLFGGSAQASVGQVTLAHRGILLLDELHEYQRALLESLRQPLESGQVMLTHKHRQTTLPALFTLIATTNPCPCGYQGSTKRACRCSLAAKQRHQHHLSGPFLDRIDLHVTLSDFELSHTKVTSFREVTDWKKQIENARQFQAQRQPSQEIPLLNAQLSIREILKVSVLSLEARKLLAQATQRLQLSGRGYHKTLAVARTIADLGATQTIELDHMAEALQYRSPYLTQLN